jgi:hypothetical protein
MNCIQRNDYRVALSKNDIFKYSLTVNIYISDPFCNKLNGLQRGTKDFFGQVNADDKNLKM